MLDYRNNPISYDANGDVLNDSLHSYAWDALGRPTTIDSVTVTYDALGRMVEQNKSGSYTEIVYDPLGSKLALMSNTSTLKQAFVSLPAGATAVYSASGLAYYRHPDWLGSSRFASTPSRTMYNDLAFAPFGEPYAQSGSSDTSFTGQNQDTTTNLYDFMYREYGIQGRWPSPDPAGLAAANPANPQSWNRYAYVLNNPLVLIDPRGLDCIYFTDDGKAVESDDTNSNGGECAANGGDWVNGSLDWWSYDPGSDTFNLGSSDGNYSYFTTANAPGTQLNGTSCFGDCSLSYSQIANSGFTLQIGVAINWSFWGPLTGSGFTGIAIDSHGHIATYWGGGGGMSAGVGVSGGLQLAGSNGNSVCALGGPFTNVSGTAGFELAGTGDYFQGAGQGPGGVVQGGGLTIGGGAGVSGSAEITGTSVHPFGHSCVNGKIQ